jgi:hypothetical protein
MSNYWLYVIEHNYFKEFNKTNKKTLTSYSYEEIKKNDTIIIYKKGSSPGYIGYCNVSSDIKKRSKKIFSNKNLNKFSVNISRLKIFDKVIKNKVIFEVIKNFDNYFKTHQSFTNKYIRGNCIFNSISINYGKVIIDKLKNDIKYIKKKTEKKKKNPIEKKIVTKEDNKLKYIPIMIVPLKQFKNIYGIDYLDNFKDMCCSEYVDVTNNNNNAIFDILDNYKNVEFMKINKETNEEDKKKYYDTALDHYLNCKKYEIPNNKKKEFTRIILIEDENDIYNGCFLITFIKDKLQITSDSSEKSK